MKEKKKASKKEPLSRRGIDIVASLDANYYRRWLLKKNRRGMTNNGLLKYYIDNDSFGEGGAN